MRPVPLSLPMFALNFQCSLSIGKAAFSGGIRFFGGIKDYSGLAIDALHQTSTIDKFGIVFDEISCEGRDASDIPRRRL